MYNKQSVDSNLNSALTNYETLLSKSTYLSEVDLNDYKGNGYYTKNGSCTNQPTSRPGNLIVSNGKAYKTQEYICAKINNSEYAGVEHYVRWCSDTNVWTPWSKLTTETDLNGALANYTSVTKKNKHMINNATETFEIARKHAYLFVANGSYGDVTHGAWIIFNGENNLFSFPLVTPSRLTLSITSTLLTVTYNYSGGADTEYMALIKLY